MFKNINFILLFAIISCGGFKDFPATPIEQVNFLDNPHINFMEQPWWTDGKRAVLIISEEYTSLYDLEEFSCNKK